MWDIFFAKWEEKKEKWDEKGFVDLFSRLGVIDIRKRLSKRRMKQVLEVLHRKWNDVHSRNLLISILLPKDIDRLSIDVRIAFVHALQQGRTSHQDELRIADIICSTYGLELNSLKNGIEHQDHHNLYNLIYHDIQDSMVREKILSHFAQEETMTDVRIISDIDDTIYANWIDEKFPKKTLYPGVLSFFHALSPLQDKLVFLTARPKDRGHFSERLTRKRLQGFGFAHPVVLVGRWHQLHSDEVILERKWSNVQAYQRLYPKSRFVFIGDSGQLDAVIAQKMYEEGTLMLGLIHQIGSDKARTHAEDFPNIRFFRTYSEAAFYAWEIGLISSVSVDNVMEQSKRDLEQIASCSDQRWQEWREARTLWQNKKEVQ